MLPALFGFAILLSGCARKELKKGLTDFIGTNIALPADLQSVKDGSIMPYAAQRSDATLIIYYDSTSCTSCNVTHLYDYMEIVDIAEKSHGRFQVMPIFTPEWKIKRQVVPLLQTTQYPFPVYVDMEGEFARLNPAIPVDRRFHVFLLDKRRKVVCVGNPIMNDALWTLFVSTLDNLLANEGEYRP